ncbi:MAG: PHP domain-containing protein [Planctomycetaceae bacterium]|nr:PHP domain-containing protein [Planctomycetaceae bacterium]
MINYDLHIHTEYCGHADGMMVERICRRAEELGLRTIAITDHIYGPDSLPVIERIRADIAAAKPKLKVYIGAEIDVDSDYTDGRLAADIPAGLDYVIAGFHFVPTLGHYPWKIADRRLDEQTFLELWEKSLLGVAGLKGVHVMAHPGRMLAACMDLDIYFEHGLSVLAKAAAVSAAKRVAWELNELTMHRLAPRWQIEWYRIYQVALDAGVKLVFGSDAHTLEWIGSAPLAEKLLEKLPKGCLSAPEDIIG